MSKLTIDDIPADYAVRPLPPDASCAGRATCGTCGLSWDDAAVTALTPAPSARCPFERFHREPETRGDVRSIVVRFLVSEADVEAAIDALENELDIGSIQEVLAAEYGVIVRSALLEEEVAHG